MEEKMEEAHTAVAQETNDDDDDVDESGGGGARVSQELSTKEEKQHPKRAVAQHCEKKKGRTAEIRSGSGQQPTRGRVVNIFELDAGRRRSPWNGLFLVCLSRGTRYKANIEEGRSPLKQEGNVSNVKQGWNVDLFFTPISIGYSAKDGRN
ncbi:hypothetical protein DAPPUDRAFT_107176 [Daphnia pulex]|uniref:Uncharacterized protein n=1 Tax=Daphnia pulex TaxID=6669 RepID=E9GW82_DAPPU|nr:hypothetical protein DAPPUDRAFT_107176 [Daphnia pulex]|eukprot:EFX76302.1 hypothetical protein DAPPUDRAFT_107176 [Daphnia pulex]